MKLILLFIIRIYWKFIPENKRRKCIFRQTCSNYVYEETKNKGLISGIKALIFRFKNCRPNYDIYVDYRTGKKLMRLKTGIIIDENQIAKNLIE